jgi:hypothetical protein
MIQTEEEKMSSVIMIEESKPTVSQGYGYRERSREKTPPPISPHRRRLVPVELTNR